MLFLFLILLAPGPVWSEETFSVEPIKHNQGRKWRIGYYEGGEDISYQENLSMTIKGLMELGWIKSSKIPQQKGVQTKQLWNWLATRVRSDYLEFVKNAHYSSNWNRALFCSQRCRQRDCRQGDGALFS